jgi:nucleotide-binding universal stress UspA family protein
MTSVLAPIDLGPSTRRVLYHAAAFARLLSARLRVLHVTADPSAAERRRVVDSCAAEGPYEVDVADEDVIVRGGRVSDTIYREALHEQAGLVVMGSRGLTTLASLLLGSTTEAVLRNAPAPVLLVPPIDLDIVNIRDGAALTCGPVLAAIDLDATSDRQLQLASTLARVSGQSLLLMTVASRSLDDHQAGALLRQRAHAMNGGIKPHAMIVRRGDVAQEISRCAVAEGSGLVVMGLRARPRGQPGVIASEVLKTKRAFVLAVPGG